MPQSLVEASREPQLLLPAEVYVASLSFGEGGLNKHILHLTCWLSARQAGCSCCRVHTSVVLCALEGHILQHILLTLPAAASLPLQLIDFGLTKHIESARTMLVGTPGEPHYAQMCSTQEISLEKLEFAVFAQ